jgi:thiamine-monophosphate kinase
MKPLITTPKAEEDSVLYSPFTRETGMQVSSIGESTLITRIKEWLGLCNPASPMGIGDDCAVNPIQDPEAFHLTTIDGVGWGKHFDAHVPPEAVGRKLLGRNLSDIASMGGIPTVAVVALWLSPQSNLQWLERFYRGLAAMAGMHGVQVVGGDVSAAPENVFIADLCLQGYCRRPLLRRQVSPGDTLWVTGTLGGSALGKHHTFEPRMEEGQWLSESGWAKSMMDISDGLGKDLPALTGPAVVRIDPLPISEEAKQMATSSGLTAFHHAVNDGEDFELLFALDRSVDVPTFVKDWTNRFHTPITRIGIVENAPSESGFHWLDCEGKPFPKASGYEHF